MCGKVTRQRNWTWKPIYPGAFVLSVPVQAPLPSQRAVLLLTWHLTEGLSRAFTPANSAQLIVCCALRGSLVQHVCFPDGVSSSVTIFENAAPFFILPASSALSSVSLQKNILFFCYCFKNPEHFLSFHLILLWLFIPCHLHHTHAYPCVRSLYHQMQILECCLSQYSVTVTEYLWQSSYKQKRLFRLIVSFDSHWDLLS